jgi:hypothetical protein
VAWEELFGSTAKKSPGGPSRRCKRRWFGSVVGDDKTLPSPPTGRALRVTNHRLLSVALTSLKRPRIHAAALLAINLRGHRDRRSWVHPEMRLADMPLAESLFCPSGLDAGCAREYANPRRKPWDARRGGPSSSGSSPHTSVYRTTTPVAPFTKISPPRALSPMNGGATL